MKKITVFIALVLAAALFALGCNNEVVDIETDAPTAEATDAPTQKPTDAGAQNYWELKCRTIKEYTKCNFAIGEDERALTLSLPSDWELVLEGGAYDILRDGEKIGNISLSSQESSEWKEVEDYSRKHDSTLSVKKFIESCGEGKDIEYRYTFEYEYKELGKTYKLYLITPYTEIDVNAADKLYQSPTITAKSLVVEGSLSNLADGSILILGNSFIGSSQIGYVLSDMLEVNGKNMFVSPIGRGYASVATYIADDALMAQIRNGDFDGVFICGFYADAEADNLKVLEEACNSSETTLVIFPAHNEFDTPIRLAQKACPDLPILNWRAELNALIETGVDKWDLCVDDAHGHSTVYAGLVGAHMIYRSIYGEIPNIENMPSVNADAARDIIGSYLETGELEINYDIYYFN